jgi:hypothetical protein
VAYLILVGNGGWTQRWQIRPDHEHGVATELAGVGTDRTSRLALVDPQTGNEVTLFVAWHSVATAVIIPESTDHTESHGQYA